jgi:hypothetical protein
MDDFSIGTQPCFPPSVVETSCPVDSFPIEYKALVLQTYFGHGLPPNHVGGFVATADWTLFLVRPPVPPEACWGARITLALGLTAQKTVA